MVTLTENAMKTDGLLEDLKRRFRYNAWANRLVAHALVREAGGVLDVGGLGDPFPRAVVLMAHLLTAEEVWHARVHGGEGPLADLWKPVPTEDLSAIVEARALAWQQCLESLTAADLHRAVAYRTSKGEAFEQPLADVLGHVVNHGTHHRAQIVARLRQDGIAPPGTDFIYWARSVEPVN